MTAVQKKRADARAYANKCKRKGKIVPEPCEWPGCKNEAQMHHPDYSQPLKVEWMCRAHHMAWHRIVDGKFLKEENNGKVENISERT